MEQFEFFSLKKSNEEPNQAAPESPQPQPPPPPRTPPLFTPFPPLVSTLIALAGQIRQELETNIHKLLSLNPGRRDAIAQYLDRLAGISPVPSSSSNIRKWVDVLQSPAQESALRTFFEEVALITLGQAILLKSWSDRDIRPFKPQDLNDINWALGGTLKPYIPMDREGWQITRPNLYSWYKPSALIQRDLWKALETVHLTENDPSFPCQLLRLVRQFSPDWAEWKSYDVRFFQSLWENVASFGFFPETQMGPFKRKAVVFSPTLRDGTIIRSGPTGMTWIGLEKNPFHLFLAELSQLWWGPAAPPLWAVGSGLEVFGRDQLALALYSPKPSLLERITEMEACDMSLVLEERMVCGNLRSGESLELREQTDSLIHFKKLRTAGTSLGDLQACVSLSKLRPGGLLWWAREESLKISDGTEMLSYLLEKALLLCEWNFSEVSHALPGASPLFPKYLYLFKRESDVQKRLTHRPTRVHIQGQIRSHVETPHFFGDAFQAYHRVPQARGQWKLHSHQSPLPQKEWLEHWPDPSAPGELAVLEELQSQSVPLASYSTILFLGSDNSLNFNQNFNQNRLFPPSAGAIWVTQETTSEWRKIEATVLENQSLEFSPKNRSGFLIIFPNPEWAIPMAAYLKSITVQKWLDHHTERRGQKWMLTEQVLKFIPVPRLFFEALETPAHELNPLLNESEPTKFLQSLNLIPIDEKGKKLRIQTFIKAAQTQCKLNKNHAQLFSMVTPDGRIRWKKILEVLPRSECTAVTFSEQVTLSGNLPLHLPIDHMERVKTPQPGILFATETGPSLQLSSQKPRILEIVWDQLEGLHHPTWSELAQFLKVPRNLEMAEATAQDILRVHGEQSARLQQLSALLFNCPLF